MDTTKLMPVAIGAAIAYAIYKMAPNAAVKTASLGLLAVIVAKQVPYLQDAI